MFKKRRMNGRCLLTAHVLLSSRLGYREGRESLGIENLDKDYKLKRINK